MRKRYRDIAKCVERCGATLVDIRHTKHLLVTISFAGHQHQFTTAESPRSPLVPRLFESDVRRWMREVSSVNGSKASHGPAQGV